MIFFYLQKSKMDSWLKGRMALSKRASRFELPMDVMELEGMNQITYLERYCIVSSRRVALYRKAFNRVDKDCDLKINLKVGCTMLYRKIVIPCRFLDALLYPTLIYFCLLF